MLAPVDPNSFICLEVTAPKNNLLFLSKHIMVNTDHKAKIIQIFVSHEFINNKKIRIYIPKVHSEWISEYNFLEDIDKIKFPIKSEKFRKNITYNTSWPFDNLIDFYPLFPFGKKVFETLVLNLDNKPLFTDGTPIFVDLEVEKNYKKGSFNFYLIKRNINKTYFIHKSRSKFYTIGKDNCDTLKLTKKIKNIGDENNPRFNEVKSYRGAVDQHLIIMPGCTINRINAVESLMEVKKRPSSDFERKVQRKVQDLFSKFNPFKKKKKK